MLSGSVSTVKGGSIFVNLPVSVGIATKVSITNIKKTGSHINNFGDLSAWLDICIMVYLQITVLDRMVKIVFLYSFDRLNFFVRRVMIMVFEPLQSTWPHLIPHHDLSGMLQEQYVSLQ